LYYFASIKQEAPGRYLEQASHLHSQKSSRYRMVRVWRALNGPGQEVNFPQIYEEGQWCESDLSGRSWQVFIATGYWALNYFEVKQRNPFFSEVPPLFRKTPLAK